VSASAHEAPAIRTIEHLMQLWHGTRYTYGTRSTEGPYLCNR